MNLIFFFFKQKPAYELRISDWSSDVCSSDLIEIILTTGGTGFSPRDNTPEAVKPLLRREMDGFSIAFHQKSLASVGVASMQSRAFAGQAGEDRKSVDEGKSVYVRVELGGRRFIKK